MYRWMYSEGALLRLQDQIISFKPDRVYLNFKDNYFGTSNHRKNWKIFVAVIQ